MRPEDFLNIIQPDPPSNSFLLGTIPSTYTAGTGYAPVQFDGETAASTKTYPHLASYAPDPNDRVVLGKVGNGYVILGKVGYSEGSVGPYDDRYAQLAGATFTGNLLWGDGALRVETANDLGATKPSGFYQTSAPVNGPSSITGWVHYITARHSNASNNYQMQFAGDFFDANKIYYRVTNNSATSPWYKLLHLGQDSSWIGLSLVNGFSVYDAVNWGTPSYRKKPDNTVRLKGLVKFPSTSPAAYTVIANLPAGYRPASNSLFTVQANDALTRVEVRPNGDIACNATTASGWVSLWPISFEAEQ